MPSKETFRNANPFKATQGVDERCHASKAILKDEEGCEAILGGNGRCEAINAVRGHNKKNDTAQRDGERCDASMTRSEHESRSYLPKGAMSFTITQRRNERNHAIYIISRDDES